MQAVLSEVMSAACLSASHVSFCSLSGLFVIDQHVGLAALFSGKHFYCQDDAAFIGHPRPYAVCCQLHREGRFPAEERRPSETWKNSAAGRLT